MDLNEAVSVALAEAENGDKVVFTPACKSFDMFMNFEQRGEVFKDIVNRI
jgi:UDP-N-acetylmuramoylalanine--D-glutamate ligase